MVSTLQSKRKGTLSAKIHIPLTTNSVVLEKTFGQNLYTVRK